MKFLFSALVLMLSLQGCSTDSNGVVTTGDVEVEDVQVDVVEETDVVSDASDSVDSNEDVATVEEGD
jgi:PBP1b-binding outer membrane lipoprotein LpoB